MWLRQTMHSRVFLISLFLHAFLSGHVYAQDGSTIVSSSGGPSTYGTSYSGFENIRYAVFFGDSYSNNRYDINAAPHPSPAQPLGVNWPGLGSPNGPNWVAYLISQLNSSQIYGFDIAFGGATVDRKVVSPFQDYIWDFRDQVNRWRNRMGNVSRPWNGYNWNSNNSLFFIWLGINDIMRSYTWTNMTVDDNHNRILDSYFQGVSQLYASSARNFVFINVPSIHRAPTNLSPSVSGTVLQNIRSFNSKLLARINTFAASSTELTVWHINAFQIFETILNNPSNFNFRNSTQNCSKYKSYNGNVGWETTFDPSCGVPVKDYFWLDSLHPTSGVHWLVANAIRWVL